VNDLNNNNKLFGKIVDNFGTNARRLQFFLTLRTNKVNFTYTYVAMYLGILLSCNIIKYINILYTYIRV